MKKLGLLRMISGATLFVLLLFFAIQSCQNAPEKSAGELGRELYVAHCIHCHGEYGEGNGGMAELLKIPPPDLSKIAIRNDGEFPVEEVTRKIDGRDTLAGHNAPMPVYWETLKNAENLDSKKEVKKAIDHIVVYLEQIQDQPGG